MRKSFIPWVGGKSKLTAQLIPLIPDHQCYCEPFAGAAWLLFTKDESRTEILNDINTELVTLYRVVRNHLDEFVKQFRWLLVSRDEFVRFMASPPDTLTDIQRAVRFYYLVRSGYGAKISTPTFSVGTSRRSNLNLLRVEEDLSAAHLRLSRVTIEHLPYQAFIPRYDSADTFFYIDPPYFGCEDYYGKGVFSVDDFAVLRDLLLAVRGKFAMSINDTPEIRALFQGFTIRQVSLSYGIGVKSGQRRSKTTELVVLNY